MNQELHGVPDQHTSSRVDGQVTEGGVSFRQVDTANWANLREEGVNER